LKWLFLVTNSFKYLKNTATKGVCVL